MNFKHYLNFKSLPEIGKLQVSEPFKFDAQTHKISQDDNRFGRDVVIGNEETKLTFYRDHFEFIWDAQMTIDGVETNHLTHGFDYLIYLFKEKGWESEVEYIITNDDKEFITGIISFFTCSIKENEITFSIIQNTQRELIKRREDILINAFSDKDLDGNYVEPCVREKILIKALPINQKSTWDCPNVYNSNLFAFGLSSADESTQHYYYNNCQNLVETGIEGSLSFLDQTSVSTNIDINLGIDKAFLQAKYSLSDIELNFTNYGFSQLVAVGGGADGYAETQFIVRWGYDINNPIGQELIINETINDGESFIYTGGANFTVNIPYLPVGARIWVYHRSKVRQSAGAGTAPIINAHTVITKYNLEIKVISKSLDSIGYGVRLFDLINHNIKSISKNHLTSPIYDVSGEHYNNFAFNGYMLSQQEEKPFMNKFKDLMNIPKEVCADYQINEKDVEILEYKDFYKNIDLGAFYQTGDSENFVSFAKRYFLKLFELGFTKSSDERSANNNQSSEDVHTQGQWAFQSDKTDALLKIDLKHIRSAFLIEEQRKKILAEEKQVENDENLFLIDCVPLEAGSRNEFTSYLAYNDGKYLSDGTFNWKLLGFKIGDTIKINGVDVEVLNIEKRILTTSLNIGAGIGVFNFDYPLTDVFYTNRTNEGFDLIQGISATTRYSNLYYSLKRNVNRWASYLATAGKYISGKSINNTHIKVNNNLVTKLTGEVANVVDKEEITINSIADKKILNPLLYDVKVECDFDKATKLFKDMQLEKGFVRVRTIDNKMIKGYPKEVSYLWASNELSLTLEEKFELDFITVDKIGDNFVINGVFYIKNKGLKYFKINKNFVCLYDYDNILLTDITHFEKIKINGVLYTDLILFSDALTAIL